VAAVGRICDGFKTAIEEKLNCQVVAVDPYAKVKTSEEHSDGASVCVAEGLALRLLAPEKTAGINFLESANSSAKRTLSLKKELIILAILAAAIVLISLGGLFMRLLMLESEYAHVKDEIRDVFQRTLPKETSITNPLAQLEQKLQLLRKDYSSFSPVSENGLGPLEVLYAVSTTVSSEANISIDSMLITSESVRLTGVSASFESVYNWQRVLERIQGFSGVEAENVGKDSKSQLVHFTMIISLAAELK
jgi:Tfp pilus assembly protein PilN